MPHNRPLKLKVAGEKDFLIAGIVVSGLIVIASLLSPQALPMTIFTVVTLGAVWRLFTLKMSKVTGTELTSVIFPDGRLRLESAHQNRIEGVISGQQWCNSQFAVLRYITGGSRHNLVLLSANQQAGDYRRLMVWLRQDLLLKNEGRVQS